CDGAVFRDERLLQRQTLADVPLSAHFRRTAELRTRREAGTESPRHSVAQVEFVRALAEHTANRAGELELLRELTAVDEVDMANERVGTTPVSADWEGSRQSQRHRES